MSFVRALAFCCAFAFSSHRSRRGSNRKFVIFFVLPRFLGFVDSDDLVNCHSACLRLDIVEADRVEIRVLIVLLGREKVRLETFAEVGQANDTIGNGQDDEENSDDGERGERLLHGLIVQHPLRLVNSHKLEDEVRKTAVVEDDDHNHASFDFTASEDCRSNEDDNRNRNSGDSEGEFGIAGIRDNDDELDNEAEEEKEVELEQSNVNLVLLAPKGL
jgi:hypothetical protein